MMIPRQLAPILRETCSLYPVLSVTGPRQSGKTTLLQNLFPDYGYVNFEEPNTRRFFEEDPLGFLKLHDRYVIFDEAQRVPELFSYLQVKTDADKVMGQFIISGSQNFLLLEKITQSLAGRVALFRLLALSHAELAANQPDLRPSELADNILKGGYPALYDRPIPLPRFFQNYLETYVERDARSLINIKDLNAFQNFLRLCAGRAGQILNIHTLCVDAGISAPTAKSWLSILEASYILFQLPPFFENFNKRLVKSPKLYFYDTGLLCHLLGLSTPEQIFQYYQRGALFENMAILELMKNRWNSDRHTQFFFWQDSNKVEVDLVELDGIQTHLYEMKYSQTPTSDFLKGIKSFRNAAPLQRQQGKNMAIYAGEERQPRSEAIIESWRNLPVL
ncbi:MAG: ATP-binding protein [Saprospiraceae bacterium]|nr:ATP-binding protein [Saprospiraceae bacterium]